MPRDLAMAGWGVALLAPEGSLAERSRYVRKIGHLPANAGSFEWVQAFAAMVKATAPQLVIPCDDTAFRLMQQLVIEPPETMQSVLHLQLATLIVDSLGDPAHYRASVDKTLLCPAAQAAGVRVPPYAVISAATEAKPFVAAYGWPVVLKRSHSSAGEGVAICGDIDTVTREFARLLRSQTLNLDDSDGHRLLVQAYVPAVRNTMRARPGAVPCFAATQLTSLQGNPKGRPASFATSIPPTCRIPHRNLWPRSAQRGDFCTGVHRPRADGRGLPRGNQPAHHARDPSRRVHQRRHRRRVLRRAARKAVEHARAPR